MKVAIAGAGIYGATAAIRLAEDGHRVHLFDPLGIMGAASAINQHRVHSGYHYPRSAETIGEILEARSEFMQVFSDAIVRDSCHYYAIPRQHSLTSPDAYEEVMRRHRLPLRHCRPNWLDYGFIHACYEVAEHIYDPAVLRNLVSERVAATGVRLEERAFHPEMREDYDFVVWATYGMAHSQG